jgi:hypothetical protein
MRWLVVLVAIVVGGCGSSAATNFLCAYCENDSQCFGNPCFQDVSGRRFCGKPCASGCPAGYSCQPVTGTSPGAVLTCFPDTEECVPPGSAGPDAGVADAAPPRDFSTRGDGAVPIPVGGPVTPSGGTVDRLLFGFTGDTRPDKCDGVYPQSVINAIYTGMKSKGVQFAIDQGDHMFNCSFGYQGATAQMKDYLNAAGILGKTVFMTMGNHECTAEATALCSLASDGINNNYTAFMDALHTQGIDKPYYRFDVRTASGLAVFLVVADDVWDATEQSWLTAQLTDADAHAKYTFVSKHHPDGNNDHPEFQQIINLVRMHKYTLFLTGHTHTYRRAFNDPRTLVIGCGGAPLATGGFWGYGTALQGPDDRIYVTVYDQATGNVMDKFDVGPQ